MTSLSSKSCVPCSGGVPRLSEEEFAPLLAQLRGWGVADAGRLEKSYEFPNFAGALAFVNRVGEIAEREGHHPDVSFGWGYARLVIYTHAVGGLTESDFVLAAKVDEIDAA